MIEPMPLAPERGSSPVESPTWRVRLAERRDAAAIAGAVAELLVELGAAPPPEATMQDATRALLEDPDSGVLLVAEAGDELVGVLAVSWQTAIHVPGRYGLIQDIWVRATWRSRAIGAALIAALAEQARAKGIARLEVGLPKASFSGRGATEAFYRANGFEPLGPRMRWLSA